PQRGMQGMPSSAGMQSGSPQSGQQSGQSGGEQGSEGGDQSGEQSGGQAGDEQQQFEEMLRRIAERKREALDRLPPDPAGKMKDLQNYEFLSPEAQHKFQELVEQLRQSMTQSFFNDVQKMVE